MQIHRRVRVLERDHGPIQDLVCGMVEVLGLDLGEDRVERGVIEEDRREDGLLRLEVVGRDAALSPRCRPELALRRPSCRPRHATPPGIAGSPDGPLYHSAAVTFTLTFAAISR